VSEVKEDWSLRLYLRLEGEKIGGQPWGEEGDVLGERKHKRQAFVKGGGIAKNEKKQLGANDKGRGRQKRRVK